MNKIDVLKAIIALLEVQYTTAVAAAKQAHSTATDEETVAENKYDTFALEASYLAHGQSQRVIDCENNLRNFNTLPIKHWGEEDAIKVGALVTLINHDDERRQYFIGPCCGGVKVNVANQDCMVISPQSTLGQTLIGKYCGDEVSIPVAGQLVLHDIELVQ